MLQGVPQGVSKPTNLSNPSEGVPAPGSFYSASVATAPAAPSKAGRPKLSSQQETTETQLDNRTTAIDGGKEDVYGDEEFGGEEGGYYETDLSSVTRQSGYLSFSDTKPATESSSLVDRSSERISHYGATDVWVEDDSDRELLYPDTESQKPSNKTPCLVHCCVITCAISIAAIVVCGLIYAVYLAINKGIIEDLLKDT